MSNPFKTSAPDNNGTNLHSRNCRSDKADINLTHLADKLSEDEKNYISDLLENDPLNRFYKKALFIYLTVAITLLLWPFDFTFSFPQNNAARITTSNGVKFSSAGKIISDSPATPLYDRILSGSGLSLEVWVTPAFTNQSGPARIISYSLNHKQRNFTLGQSEENLIMRIRTAQTDKNGLFPHMEVENVFSSIKRSHIIVTYNFSRQRVYINGQLRAEKEIPGGDFSNWDPSYYLVVGNEVTGERPWAGKIFYMAIYNRELSAHEVRYNYSAEGLEKYDSQKQVNPITAGLVARYFFDEHGGDLIKDSSGNMLPLNLHLPEKLKPDKRRFLTFYLSQFTDIHNTSLNILIFIPFGFFLSGIVQKKRRPLITIFFIVLTFGALFTLSIESTQFFLVSRISSLVDIINNILGTISGVIFFSFWKILLKSQGKQLKDIF